MAAARITVLVDNTAGPGLVAEHGFAALLESGGTRVLFDTGGGKALPANLAALGFSPDDLDGCILSHGHWDHTGGLEWLLKARKASLDVWCHPAAFIPKLGRRWLLGLRPLGPQLSREAYEALGAVFHWAQGGQAGPWPGFTIMAPIERLTPFEKPSRSFLTISRGSRRIDPMEDDLAVLLEGGGKAALVSGCAHAGPINQLLQAERICGRTPDYYLGGTHLGPAGRKRLQRTIAEFASRPGLKIAPCHCTAEAGHDIQHALGNNYLDIKSGFQLEF